MFLGYPVVRGSLLAIGEVSLAFTVRLALKPIIGETSPFLRSAPSRPAVHRSDHGGQGGRRADPDHRSRNSNLDLDLEWDGEECPVLADPLRLHQVFTNLLSNAVKFTPIGGRVGVTMARTSTQTTIAISDTGVGIAPEFLHRMFHPFEQDSHTVSFSRRGLGLGLSICRHLVEQHGGAITAASDGPGKGTTVTVTLPLATATRCH